MRPLLCALVLVLCGCAHVTAESSFQQKGLARAAFELGCPQEELKTSVLVRNDGLGCAGSQMAVAGCGKKAVYVCTRSQDWINNTGVSN